MQQEGSPGLPFLFSDTLPPVNQPTPAIVSQDAVRRLPRWALLLFCIAYVVPGFVGRAPWKSADMTTLGYIFELAQGNTSWLSPTMVGTAPEFDALIPYWLGAWAMQLGAGWLEEDDVRSGITRRVARHPQLEPRVNQRAEEL